MEPKQWVGIDVSGKRLEVFFRPLQRILKVANSPAGLATLVSELFAIDPALIVIEATANWHLAAVAALSGTSPTHAHWVDLLSSDGLNAFEADLMLPQITEIILIKKPLVDAETKLRKKHFPGVGRERDAAPPAHAVLLATNHKWPLVRVSSFLRNRHLPRVGFRCF
jgi:hypothetical protein